MYKPFREFISLDLNVFNLKHVTLKTNQINFLYIMYVPSHIHTQTHDHVVLHWIEYIQKQKNKIPNRSTKLIFFLDYV